MTGFRKLLWAQSSSQNATRSDAGQGPAKTDRPEQASAEPAEALARRELLNPPHFDALKRIADPHTGNAPVQRDFGERHQHEAALE